MTKNLFWTGGFDSTFRLLQLIDDNEVLEINLYYISIVIDNIESSEIRRKSNIYEIQTMYQILSNINIEKVKSFTIFGKNEDLLHYSFIFNFPFMNYINRDSIEYSDKNKVFYFDLFVNGLVLRPINQWGGITQILDDLDIEAEICLEKGGGIWSKINKYVVNGEIQYDLFKPLKAFSNYQIPLFDIDREEMVSISSNKNWDDILKITWSCWYPKNNLPCGRCFTCKRRPF
jgi:hypothetical protein